MHQVLSAVALLILLADAVHAQEATPIALKFRIADPIREPRYGMTPETCAQFELGVANQICDEIRRRYWKRYCWRITPTDKKVSAPDGEIQLELVRSLNGDNWDVMGLLERTNYPPHQFDFGRVPLFATKEDREYFNAHSGCPKEELADRLIQYLWKQFFSEDAGPRLLKQLRPIPVGQGVVVSANPPLPAKHGAVLLPWKDYMQFHRAVFRFEVEVQGGQSEEWLAKALGRLAWGQTEVLDVEHQKPVPPRVKDRGLVYLEKVDFQSSDPFSSSESNAVPLTDR